MKLATVTITGLDDNVDPREALALSDQYPWLEWGVLASETRMGTNRYPSKEWIHKLADTISANKKSGLVTTHPQLALHLCGATMKKFMANISPTKEADEWCQPWGMTPMAATMMFNRMQLNFNATREAFSPSVMTRLYEGWCEGYGGSFITQHNANNTWVWEAIQREAIKYPHVNPHQVLHDGSGGNGRMPTEWPKPIAGVLNGYAGGINPNNVMSVLDDLQEIVGDGYIWIDMESGVRDKDDRLNLSAIRHMLGMIAMIGQDQRWF